MGVDQAGSISRAAGHGTTPGIKHRGKGGRGARERPTKTREELSAALGGLPHQLAVILEIILLWGNVDLISVRSQDALIELTAVVENLGLPPNAVLHRGKRWNQSSHPGLSRSVTMPAVSPISQTDT